MTVAPHDFFLKLICFTEKSFLVKCIFLFFATTFFSFKVQSQSIAPFTLNNGGGNSSTMEWSMMESVSIANFTGTGYILNTGVLQPLTNIITAINEYGPSVFGNQITIGPNPTTNLLHIKARLNQVGNLTFQLLDARSALVLTLEAGTIYSSYEKNILMEQYPAGVFYMRVYFKPINGSAKTGIYKIVKL